MPTPQNSPRQRSVLWNFKFLTISLAGTLTMALVSTFAPLSAQIAILGVGAVQKRAVVINDAIAVRPMGYLSLSFDHRVIDGATADRFMTKVKRYGITPRPA